MGALVGLGVGVGLLLVWSAFFVPVRPRVPGRHGRTAELLARAGLGEVSITGFLVLCLVVRRGGGLRRPGREPYAAGRARLRAHRRLPAGGRGERARAATAA